MRFLSGKQCGFSAEKVRSKYRADAVLHAVYTDLLIGKSGTYIYDIYIYDVCDDELAPFYNDDQSAEETARRIQKRISMYLNEQK